MDLKGKYIIAFDDCVDEIFDTKEEVIDALNRYEIEDVEVFYITGAKKYEFVKDLVEVK